MLCSEENLRNTNQNRIRDSQVDPAYPCSHTQRPVVLLHVPCTHVTLQVPKNQDQAHSLTFAARTLDHSQEGDVAIAIGSNKTDIVSSTAGLRHMDRTVRAISDIAVLVANPNNKHNRIRI